MPVIEVEHLRKRYRDVVAVDDVSFAVERGEIFGILGPNGAGKTTTVEIIEGLRTPDGGNVRVLGLDPQRDGGELRRRVGAQLQESELPDKLKVWEALELYSSFYDRPADWRRLLQDLGLAGKHNARFGKLSGGQKQRLSIALALVGNPEIAVLDELTTGLDPQARRDTWELIEGIRDRGVTVVLVTHFMEEAERLADRVAVIDAGKLVAIDSPAGLVSRLDAGQRIRFRPTTPLDDRILTELPEVRSVQRSGSQVLVTGTGEAANGAEAVARVERHGADVVLMDLRMPEMGGVEAIRRLRETAPSVRVLVLTTYDTDSDVLPAIEAGAIGYLLKDAPRDELIRAVRAAFKGESVLSPAVARRLMGQVRKPPPEALSQRELKVLQLIADGATNREAAARLFVSEATIKTHLLHIYDKLGVRDRAAAVGEAYRRRLLS